MKKYLKIFLIILLVCVAWFLVTTFILPLIRLVFRIAMTLIVAGILWVVVTIMMRDKGGKK